MQNKTNESKGNNDALIYLHVCTAVILPLKISSKMCVRVNVCFCVKLENVTSNDALQLDRVFLVGG